MTLRQKLLLVADRYAAEHGIGRKRVSTLVMKGGAKLDAIASGSDLTTGSYERAMLWFSINWPSDAAWPADIDRPQPAEAAE